MSPADLGIAAAKLDNLREKRFIECDAELIADALGDLQIQISEAFNHARAEQPPESILGAISGAAEKLNRLTVLLVILRDKRI